MAKRLRIIALCSLMGLFFASCSQPSLIGTWVQPAVEDGMTAEEGFTLLESGEVIPINMGHYEYHHWERAGKIVYFKGTNTGYNPGEFVDTMKIVKLDEQELVLEQEKYGFTVSYQRK